MIKKNIYIIITLLLLSGCVERGTPQVQIPTQTVQENNTSLEKDNSIPTLVVNARENRFDTIENKVSGSLILLIGIIIFL